MSELPELFMKAFIDLVSDKAKDKGLKKGEFAQRIWPESSVRVARNRWHNMRLNDPITGHPQGVIISDAWRMAEALGEDLAYLMLRAKDLALKRRDGLDEKAIKSA